MRGFIEAVEAANEYWNLLVRFAMLYPTTIEIASYAQTTKQSFSSVRRKVLAIQYCLSEGQLSVEAVMGAGQEATLGIYQVAINESKEPRKNVTMGVRLSQKPLLEAQIERLKELLGSKERPATTELVTDWLCSHLEQLSDSQIRNEAQGVG